MSKTEMLVGDLKIEVHRKRIKNLHLRVHPPQGRVSISAPKRMSLEMIQTFALSKLDWIKEQQAWAQTQQVSHVPRGSWVEKWCRQELAQVVPAMVTRWESILNVKVERISYRSMTSRWGSCTPNKKSIRFNTELARRPLNLLEYVVVHEMIHLLEASHNARFIRLMDHHMPDWRWRRDKLNRK